MKRQSPNDPSEPLHDTSPMCTGTLLLGLSEGPSLEKRGGVFLSYPLKNHY